MLERSAAESAALATELRNVVFQTEALLVALSEERAEAVAEIKLRVSEALHAARERLLAAEAAAERWKKEATLVADEYAQERPWTIVSAGFAVGLLLGAWIAPERG